MVKSTTSLHVGVNVSNTNVGHNRKRSSDEKYERVDEVLRKLREEKLISKTNHKSTGNNVTFKKSPSDWDRPWRSSGLKVQNNKSQKTQQQKLQFACDEPSKCGINENNYCACGQDECEVVAKLPQNSGATYCADDTCGRAKGESGQSCRQMKVARIPSKCGLDEDNYCACGQDECEVVGRLPQDSGATYCADETCGRTKCDSGRSCQHMMSVESLPSKCAINDENFCGCGKNEDAFVRRLPRDSGVTYCAEGTCGGSSSGITCRNSKIPPPAQKVDVSVSFHQITESSQTNPVTNNYYKQNSSRDSNNTMPFTSVRSLTEITPFKSIRSVTEIVQKQPTYNSKQISINQTISSRNGQNPQVTPTSRYGRSNLTNRATSPVNIKRKKGCCCFNKYLAALTASQQNSSKCCGCKSRCTPKCCNIEITNCPKKEDKNACKCPKYVLVKEADPNNTNNKNGKSSCCNNRNDYEDCENYPQHNYPPYDDVNRNRRQSFNRQMPPKSKSKGNNQMKRKSCIKENKPTMPVQDEPSCNCCPQKSSQGEKYRLVASIPNACKPSNIGCGCCNDEDYNQFLEESQNNNACQNIHVNCLGVCKPQMDDCDCCACDNDDNECCECPDDSRCCVSKPKPPRPLVIVNNSEVCDCKDKWARVDQWQKEMLCRERAMKRQQAQKEEEERYRRRCERKREEYLRRKEKEERKRLEKKHRDEERRWRRRQMEAEKNRMERDEARWAQDMIAREEDKKVFDVHEKLNLEMQWRKEQLKHYGPCGVMACPELEELRRALAPVPLDGMNETFEYFCCEPAKPEKKVVDPNKQKRKSGEEGAEDICSCEESPVMQIEPMLQQGQVKMRFPQSNAMTKTSVRLQIPPPSQEGCCGSGGGRVINIFTGPRRQPPPPPCCPKPCCPPPCCPPNPCGETIPPQVLNYIDRIRQITNPCANSWLGTTGMNPVVRTGFPNYNSYY